MYTRTRDRSRVRVVPGSTRGEPPPSAWGRPGTSARARLYAQEQAAALKGVAHSHDGSVALGILHIALWEKR